MWQAGMGWMGVREKDVGVGSGEEEGGAGRERE